MPNQALTEIVAVEKEIQARLTEERQKAPAWLAEERASITKGVEQKLTAAHRNCHQALVSAEAETATEVAALLGRAEEYVLRLRNLPDQRLRELVTRHLVRLLPEEKK